MAADGGSNQDGTKKRLQLMPEVLPEPKRAHGKGSVRERTVRTKDRLLAISAASAIMAGAASVSGCGYGVVDPLPPPSQCPDVLSTITAKARWKLDNGEFVIVIELGVPGQTDVYYRDLDPYVGGNTVIVSRVLNQGALTITIRTNGVSIAYVQVPIHCSAGDAGIAISLDLNAVTRADGAEIPVTLDTTNFN